MRTLGQYSGAEAQLKEADRILVATDNDTRADLDLARARLEDARGNREQAAERYSHALAIDEQLFKKSATPANAWALARTLEFAAVAIPESAPLRRQTIRERICSMADGDTSRIRPITLSARDGLRLTGHCHEASGHLRPVLCLAGLTRNGRDFHDLAVALSTGPDQRRVYTLDSRGRGLSEYDPDWRNYTIPVEMQDVIDFATVTGLHGATVIGTSRGGLIAMVLAAAQPTILGAVVLNDIGPVIETQGLARIAGYVGRAPLPNSWADATRMARELNARQFPAISDEVWTQAAHAWFNEKNGRPAAGYDPKLANALSVLDGPPPALWSQFTALKRYPMLVIRGENSDLLSARTVDEMSRVHPAIAAITVEGQGHAPLLKDRYSIDSVRHFLDSVETRRHVALKAVARV